jgi:hypothetical protein
MTGCVDTGYYEVLMKEIFFYTFKHVSVRAVRYYMKYRDANLCSVTGQPQIWSTYGQWQIPISLTKCA